VGLGGIAELHAAFLKVAHRRCRPAVIWNGDFLSSAESATSPRVPHPSRFLRRVVYHESRYRPSPIPPFAKSAKDGAPAFSWCFLPCQRPNRSLIENLFLLSRPPALPTHGGMKRVCFLSESRTRDHGWCRVQESGYLTRFGIPLRSTSFGPRRYPKSRCILGTNGRGSWNPTSGAKCALRYGAPMVRLYGKIPRLHDDENNKERVRAQCTHPIPLSWQVPRLLEFSY
jgi:hypothetical protein